MHELYVTQNSIVYYNKYKKVTTIAVKLNHMLKAPHKHSISTKLAIAELNLHDIYQVRPRDIATENPVHIGQTSKCSCCQY